MIAYGLDCMWWDAASEARVKNHWMRADTLHCPKCGGACGLMPDENEFFRTARRFEQIGHPGHEALIRWLKGRCYRTYRAALEACMLAGFRGAA